MFSVNIVQLPSTASNYNKPPVKATCYYWAEEILVCISQDEIQSWAVLTTLIKRKQGNLYLEETNFPINEFLYFKEVPLDTCNKKKIF